MSKRSKREAEILLSLVNARYGDRVTAEELEEIQKGIDSILDSSEAIHIVKLENGDEPYQFFKPCGEEK